MVLLLAMGAAAVAGTTGGIPRQPDVSGDDVVFTAGGDLWIAPIAGGAARRLTSHPGVERFARFSPDGASIAYTADYDGDANVWVVPTAGGAPNRLTWHSGGFNEDFVWDWSADGAQVYFSSRFRSPNSRYLELFSVPVGGGLPRPTPVSDVGAAAVGADGSLVFNRTFTNFRTWKRYRGGMQADLWRYDAGTKRSTQLTTFEGTDTTPMIAEDGTLYFMSDRPADGGEQYATRNLFRYVAGDKAEQLTFHTDYDVDWPAYDDGRIVYMHGGDLRVYDVRGKTDRALDLVIPDEAHQARPRHEDVTWEVEAYGVGPQAQRVAVVAHGDLFTVAAEHGDPRLIVGGSSGRILDVAWSPDGEQLAYVSDEGGEHELWLVPQAGGAPRQLTSGNTTWIHELAWSPDGKRLLYTDKRMRLWDVDASSGAKTLVDTGVVDTITHASYSRDGAFLTYRRAESNGHGAIWLYDIKQKEAVRVTTGFDNDSDPVFDPDGRWLYFSSARNYDLVGDAHEHRYVQRETQLLYAVRLQEDGPDVIPPRSDEEVGDDGPVIEVDEDDEKAAKQAKKAERKKKRKVVVDAASLVVDTDGIMERVQRLPIEPGVYWGLDATSDGLLFMHRPGGNGGSSLMQYDLEEQEVTTVLADCVGYQLAVSGEKLLTFDSMGGTAITPIGENATPTPLAGGALRTWVEPRVEWAHALDEVYRYQREFFYDPGMHGKDWAAVVGRYQALLDRAADPSDVHWLIAEVLGELNAGHAYVSSPGPNVAYQGVGYLGADLDAVDGGVKITRIFEGEPGDPSRTSPLRAPGVDVREGDWLVAIDGRPLGPNDNPYQWLVGAVGRPVVIQVNRTKNSLTGAESFTVYPMGSEVDLRYWDWVSQNRAYVAEKTGGRVGYVHVPNTSSWGLAEFLRGLYAQHDLDALVFDVRFNGGGFIPEMFLEHLTRPIYNIWVPRDGQPWRTPSSTHVGPKVCITNGYAGSGGDAFPHYFRDHGVGKLVGTTTWGGLVGIDNGLSLLIGGSITAPSFAFVNKDGAWDIERVGVRPDIVIDNPPEAAKLGQDPQLDAAIGVVLEELQGWKSPWPEPPATFPVRP